MGGQVDVRQQPLVIVTSMPPSVARVSYSCLLMTVYTVVIEFKRVSVATLEVVNARVVQRMPRSVFANLDLYLVVRSSILFIARCQLQLVLALFTRATAAATHRNCRKQHETNDK